MVHMKCSDPATSYPPLLEAVNKVAAAIASERRGSSDSMSSSGSGDSEA